MKKIRFKKAAALILAVVTAAAFFTGCSVFEYAEEADMEQAILEIEPFGYEYDLPIYADYEDPDGNKVFTVNEDPSSSDYGKTTKTPVRAVLRDHNGEPIHVPATADDGSFLYVGYDADGVRISVKEGDENIFVETDGKNRDNHYVIYSRDGGSGEWTAEEYEFSGLAGAGDYALWISVKDGSVAAGDITVNGTPSANASSAPGYSEEFPVVRYTTGASPVWEWDEYVHVAVRETGTTEKEVFYKQTLVDYFESEGYNYYSEEGYTIDECFDEFIKQLYTSYLQLAEAEIAIDGGYVEWGVPQINEINRSIYDQADTALGQLYEEIATEYGLNYAEITAGEDGEPEYPVPPTEEGGEDYDDVYKVWHVTQEPERCVGTSSRADVNSIKRAGLRRFVDVVAEYVDDERTISDEEREHFESEIAEMRSLIKTNGGTDSLYTRLYLYDVIRFMYGESQEYSLKTDGLRDWLVKDITTDEASARAAFKDELDRQVTDFKDDIEAYYDAATANETILYYADDEIFWVKHILIPFSEEQTDALEEYKEAGHTDAEVKAFRRDLGLNVEVYKHYGGNADTSVSYTIEQAYAEIKNKMTAAAADPKEAADTFEQLIYEYNTDEGIFDNEMGYAVTATPEALGGREESYMIEFATESRALYNAYRNDMNLYDYKMSSDRDNYVVDELFDDPNGAEVEVGSISVPVLTDYGWHIMFLNVVPNVGQRLAFDSYLTPAKQSTAGEAFVSDVTAASDNYFENWSATMANRRFNSGDVIVERQDRLGPYLDDYEERFSAQADADAAQEAAGAEEPADTTTT